MKAGMKSSAGSSWGCAEPGQLHGTWGSVCNLGHKWKVNPEM